MGFDMEKFHKWLIKRGWLTSDITYDDFVKSINGTNISVLVKAYDESVKTERKIRELEGIIYNLKKIETGNYSSVDDMREDINWVLSGKIGKPV